MPFIDVDKLMSNLHPTVQTPFLWALKDKSMGGALVVRGDGGLEVEVHGETGNSAEFSSKDAKRLAILILKNQGIDVEEEKV